MSNLPFDEQCRILRDQLKEAFRLPEEERKRIIRRILLRWHPDKNPDNFEYCIQVFQYIKVVISKLENSESLTDDTNEQPPERRDFDEATRWLQQAKRDYQTANTMRQNAENANSYNWVCFVCYQASENALRAACYARDANKMPSSEDLSAFGTTPEMIQVARSLQLRIGNPARARYPEQRSRIPSDIFTSDDADFCLKAARKLIELAEGYIESR